MSQVDRVTGLVGNAAFKVPCHAATTAAITLSGEQTVDGVALVAGDRCLVKNQASSIANGIYVVDTGDWYRAKDADGDSDFVTGSLVLITGGTVNAALIYELTTAGDIEPGTTALTWAVYSAGGIITAFPVTLAQGGSGATSAISALAAFGVVQITGEAGTANAQTGAIDALVTAFRADQIFIMVPSVTNTGPATVTLTPAGGAALAAQNVFVNGAALVGGEMVASTPVLLQHDGTRLNIIGAGKFRNLSQDLVPAKATDFLYTYDASAGVYKRIALQDVPLSTASIQGLILSNNVADATNDIDISAGAARDSTDTVNIFLTAALTKRLDAAWAVGSGNGGLDTGAIGNSDYYLHLIKRSDTGVVDALFSLSHSAPTMPASYDYRRLIGWFKRVGATIVVITTQEIEGGGLELKWTTPTLDVNLANTLTTARRTDAVKVPLNFAVLADLNVSVADAGAIQMSYVYCPDHADQAPSGTAAPLASARSGTAYQWHGHMRIRTSAAGLIAARSELATVDLYEISTLGFSWSRRNAL